MLIQCPECMKEISDKALSCPNCGYPMQDFALGYSQLNKITKGSIRQTKREHRRLPNGFGTIRKLSGNRRKPYAVYAPTASYDDNGKALGRNCLGYFKDWYEAYDCLAKYHLNDNKRSLTFADVFYLFYEDKFSNPLKEYSELTKNSYEYNFHIVKCFHEMQFVELTLKDYQGFINDNADKSYAWQNSLRTLLNQMYEYALREELVDKDQAEGLQLKGNDTQMGIPFTVEDIRKLWAHSDEYFTRIALILLYTGLRIGELKKVNIDLENRIMQGGLKTTAGKNRIIPIHPDIYPFVKEFDQQSYNSKSYGYRFEQVKQLCGISKEVEGNNRTPHDLRHTFSWMWDKFINEDEVSKHLIMGHSLGADVEKSTYGHRDYLRSIII
ncbi:MAG: hypothetical protein E7273_12320 [Pseudobutyrivibrio ruminis]|nr:hypothetical protein [Pseudobutyrivibrio ruminis]